MRSIAILAILFFTIKATGQNLIVNGNAEIEPYAPLGGWTLLQGSWTIENANTNFITPHGGLNHFAVPGACPLEATTGKPSEMYQDIDVSSYAASIDASKAQFDFTGWVATYQSQDNSRIVIEYRDASNIILYTFDSGYLKKNTWFKVTNSKVAPINTRIIRIRLISKCGGTTGDDDGYYDDLSLTVTITAPISLIYFNATTLTNKVELSWATAKEENNDYFTVEKSIDGVYWETLSTIKVLGNSNTNKGYLSYDYNPNIGLQYYRLLQTDIGGKTSIYPTRSVNYMASTGDIYLYKNDQNEVLVHGNGILKVSVYTQDGAFVKRESFDEYTETTELNISQIPQGFFIFSIETANEIINLKYISK